MPRGWPAILTIGWILVVVAICEGGVALYSLAIGDGLAGIFAEDALAAALVGGGCILVTNGRAFELRFRDATLLTVLAWFVVPVFIAFPLAAAPIGLSPVDAYFEAVSGITTTGSTVLSDIDHKPPSILIWRSLSQWIGGVGIIGFAIAILPFLKVGGMQLFRLEFSDRSDKALPRVRSLALAIAQIYLGLTVLCFLAYWMLGMSAFDALNHALTTVPTGGFSTHDASFGFFASPPLEWASIVFMLLAAIPFLAYLRLVHRRRGFFRRLDPQVEALLVTVSVATLIFALWLFDNLGFSPGQALTEAAFDVVSIVTTTGYASLDYLTWGAFAAAFFLVLTVVGGCAGSTTGGVKMFRFQIAFSTIGQTVRTAIYPHAAVRIRHGDRVVTDEQLGSVGTFIFLFVAVIVTVALLLSIVGLDTETALSAAATAVANVGPGVGPLIGPSGNFASLPEPAKIILSVAMVMGRLEILSVLVLLFPRLYR